MALGGGGIVTLIIVLAIVLLGGNLGGGGGLGGLGDLAGETAGTAAPGGLSSTASKGPTERAREAASSSGSSTACRTTGRKPYGTGACHDALLRRSVSTACGATSSAVGPFYARPTVVYIDLGFFDELGPSAARRPRSRGPTCSPMSTATMSRT